MRPGIWRAEISSRCWTDDTLAPQALAFVCEAINQNPGSDLFYSDEDKIDDNDARFDPFFKPDLSPIYRSENYVCHLLVMRRDLAEKTAIHPAVDGSQDYDLVLRASELAVGIQHIPKVLYHWRAGTAPRRAELKTKAMR